MVIDLKIGMPIWEFEIGHRFENFKKGKRSEDFNRFQPTDVLLCIFTLDKNVSLQTFTVLLIFSII